MSEGAMDLGIMAAVVGEEWGVVFIQDDHLHRCGADIDPCSKGFCRVVDNRLIIRQKTCRVSLVQGADPHHGPQNSMWIWKRLFYGYSLPSPRGCVAIRHSSQAP